MKKLSRILLIIVSLAAGIIGFTGCHTAHGFGQDMENAGQHIQDNTQ